tara:strand:+ start:3683 stop:3919 length:237 start_codon:yes stop_codon:yes gene_type:complete
MEETEKPYKFLDVCAEIAKLLNANPLLTNSLITTYVPHNEYDNVLIEIEKFVRVRVDRENPQISITISDTEFLFIKED